MDAFYTTVYRPRSISIYNPVSTRLYIYLEKKELSSNIKGHIYVPISHTSTNQCGGNIDMPLLIITQLALL